MQNIYQYPLKNHKFQNFDVQFKNCHQIITKKSSTKIKNNMVCHTPATYMEVNNNSDILTMIIYAKPTINISIQLNDEKKCIIINTKPNDFVQEEGHAFLHHTETIEMIDTKKYVHFIVN
jgi:hypothetical protein